MKHAEAVSRAAMAEARAADYDRKFSAAIARTGELERQNDTLIGILDRVTK